MEITTRDGAAPVQYIPSCSCIVVIKRLLCLCYCRVFVSHCSSGAFRYTGSCDGCHGCGR